MDPGAEPRRASHRRWGDRVRRPIATVRFGFGNASLTLFQNQTRTWGRAAVHLALGDQAQPDASRAAAYVAESLIRYREIGHQEGISLCLAGLAWAVGGLGQPVRAARLFGATAGLRASIGIGERGPPIERLLYEAKRLPLSTNTAFSKVAAIRALLAGQNCRAR